MAAPTIRHASTRPTRRAPPPWSGRTAPAKPPVRRTAPARASMWQVVAAPLSFLAVAVGVAGVMTVWMSSRTAPSPPPAPPVAELSAAEAIRLRFVPELASAAVVDLARSDFADRFGGTPGASPATAPGQAAAYAPVAPAWPATAAPEPGRTRPANALLNDAQIASIKGRLKLTPDQESLWAPVETALRGVVWRRSASDRRGTGPATLDAQSIERLKSAAAPLMGTLRDEQKREIKTLTHVMGIGDLAEKL